MANRLQRRREEARKRREAGKLRAKLNAEKTRKQRNRGK